MIGQLNMLWFSVLLATDHRCKLSCFIFLAPYPDVSNMYELCLQFVFLINSNSSQMMSVHVFHSQFSLKCGIVTGANNILYETCYLI